MVYKGITKHFLNGTVCEQKYIIFCKYKNKWLPLGDDNGIIKFDSKEDRDQKIIELQKQPVL